MHTGFGSSDRRLASRETWFPSDPDGLLRLEQATGIAFRFVIGRSKNAKKTAELHKEMEKYKNFMVIDVEEDNLNVPYKSLAFFKAAFELFEAEYHVKVDDVIYLCPDRLAILVAKEQTHPLTYIGCMKKGPVITDSKMKWYEKSGHLIGNEYFLHAYGPIYVLSAEMVASLAAARNNRMFSNEDVTIGSWMLSMSVHHEDNRAICDPGCTPTSIALGIMADVEYEDYEIVKFPFYYQVFPDVPTDPVKLPTVNYSDFGFPSNFHITVCYPPKWTLTLELSEQKRNEFTSYAQMQLDHYNKIKGANFEFVRQLQTFHCRGNDHYFQFEVKPSGAADHTLKTFEGAVYEQLYPTPASWPVTCGLVGPNS